MVTRKPAPRYVEPPRARLLPSGVEIPWRINTTSNAKGHWRPRYAAAKHQRRHTAEFLRQCVKLLVGLPLTVRLTRVGRRELDDDNNVAAFKHIRDGVADWLGINDNDKRVRWEYAQAKGDYAVRIEFEATR